jgi:hypothetical protein
MFLRRPPLVGPPLFILMLLGCLLSDAFQYRWLNHAENNRLDERSCRRNCLANSL